MLEWLIDNIGLAIGLVLSAMGAAITLRAEVKRNREVLERLERWLVEHEQTLDDHGTRISRVEGRLDSKWGKP